MEEVVAPEVQPEAVFRNSIAVIAAALRPRAVIAIPRFGARLDEAAAHLLLMLWDAARVNAAIGGARSPDAAMIGATLALLRSWRRFVSWRLMLLRCGFCLLVLLSPLLVLLPLLLTLLFVLCIGRSSDSEKQKQSPYGDSQFHRHAFSPFENLAEISLWTSKRRIYGYLPNTLFAFIKPSVQRAFLLLFLRLLL